MAVRLGLVGGQQIRASKAPALHRLAGAEAGLDVEYDLFVTEEGEAEVASLFDRLAAEGYRGVNVTYPWKETAHRLVRPSDDLVAALGAVNTVRFAPDGPVGFNTDCTGFVAAWRGVMGGASTGIAALIGAGGVGKAIGFGLVRLGAAEIRILDRDEVRAEALARALAGIGGRARVVATPAELATGATGFANATPVGMIGHEGEPLDPDLLAGAAWAFDAVYTPPETRFLASARAAGLKTISGVELFVHQGLDAFEIFTGTRPDEAAIRAGLGL